MTISNKTRAQIVRLSNYRCSYCHISLNNNKAEVDHIYPRAKGGTDDLSNLTLACGNCNTRKSDLISAIDPVTNEEHCLFNPKKQLWDEHFHIWAGDVCGKTKIGRATAHVLFQRYNTDVYQREWNLIEQIENEEIRDLLTQERGNRLRNRFNEILKVTVDDNSRILFSSLDPSQQRKVLRATSILSFERTCMEGFGFQANKDLHLIARIEPQLKHPDTNILFRRMIYLNQAIMLGQLATIEYLKGNIKAANQLQYKAAEADLKGCNKKGRWMPLIDRTRQAMLRTKYEVQPDFGNFGKSELLEAVQEAQNGNSEPITYIASWALAGKDIRKSRVRFIEAAGEIISEILEKCGYGLSYNVGPPIILRRRWWAFHLVSHSNFDEKLLQADLEMWLYYRMHNEIRSLAAALMHTHQVIGLKNWKRINSILNEYMEKAVRRESYAQKQSSDQLLFGLGLYQALFQARLV